jgi:hypothetical protein
MRKKVVLILTVLLCGSSSVFALGPVTWDILDEHYGSGAGEVSFNGQYTYPFSGQPVETRLSGKVVLELPKGVGFFYPARTPILGMTTNDANVTIEIKLRTPNKTACNFFVSETSSLATSSWDIIFQLNRISQTASPDSLADFSRHEEATNIAPQGFDGSAVHTYRFVRQSHFILAWLVDDQDNPVLLDELVSELGAGAANDGYQLYFGFAKDLNIDSTVEVYYVKIANGSYPEYTPTQCGDPMTIYLPSDFNQDCYVTFVDFAEFASRWLNCNDPRNSLCDVYYK